MFDTYEKIDQGVFSLLLANLRQEPEIILNGTPKGFEIFLRRGDELYKLYTQRKKERLFKSANTAFSFLDGFGIDSVEVRQFGKVVSNLSDKTKAE